VYPLAHALRIGSAPEARELSLLQALVFCYSSYQIDELPFNAERDQHTMSDPLA
jgi:hypothetical protein